MTRRKPSAGQLDGGAAGGSAPLLAQHEVAKAENGDGTAGCVRLFLCGDVMTARGVDQILPHPSNPRLHESWARSAIDYVALAERASGPIGRGLDYAYPWGDALAALEQMQPHARIVNLETAVTTSEHAQQDKGIHYRMHPGNMACLTSAGIDCCVLANNHVLDWGRAGLAETLSALRQAGLQTAGAGANMQEAAAPAAIRLDRGGRILVFGFATSTSGVPRDWAAGPACSGVNFLAEISAHSARAVAAETAKHRRPGDIVVVSVHWGGNWGFEIEPEHRAFAHRLVDEGGADIVHGHSSHHVQGIEVRAGKLILYGCGDFLNDYEGIRGHREFRPDLCLMYFPEVDPATGSLRRLQMVPMRIRRLRLERAPSEGVTWLRDTLEREGRALGTHVTADEQGTLTANW
jgi:poly-gamma-glutamate capsule biosynthesis protein CapA/YwtB (metallophosphatase superfamily)